MSFIAELKRRNVFKVAAAYVVVSWLVMQISDTLGDALELSAPMGKYIFVALVAGFPLALFLAWAYELTPEGVKKAEEVTKDESITHVTGQKINYFIIGLMAIALGYFIWKDQAASVEATPAETEQIAQAEPAEEPVPEDSKVDTRVSEKSIAVLPFINMSSDEEQEYFSDGLSEELLNVLAHIPQLKVAARTSSFYFKGKDVKIADIAQQLNVAHVLEGSVRKAGNTIRITAQLIRAADGFHLWSGTYDRKLDDVFVIQDEIAHAIVDALQVKMGLAGKNSNPIANAIQSTSPEAHNAYLLGKQLLRQRNEKSIEEAIVHFQRALEIDPEYTPALARQAEAWLLLRNNPSNYGRLTDEQALARARPLIEKAIAINPDSAEVLASRGLKYWIENQFEEALTDWDRVLQLNPNHTEVRVWRTILLGNMGRYSEQKHDVKENYEKDPLSVLAASNYLVGLANMQQDKEFNALLSSFKSYGGALSINFTGYAQWLMADYTASALSALQFYKLEGSRSYEVVDALNLLGLGDTAQALADVSGNWRTGITSTMTNQDWSAVMEITEKQEQRDSGQDLRLFKAWLYAMQGDWQKSLEIYLDVWAERSYWPHSHRGFYWNFHFVQPLIYFIEAEKRVGDKNKTAVLLGILQQEIEKLREVNWHPRAVGFLRPTIYLPLAVGDEEQALEIIEKQVNEGWVDAYIQLEPWLEPLKDKPRYKAAMEKMKANRLKQRHLFLKEVCTHNPYADFWQPGEEHCKEVQP